ncbi:hypothetical protein DH2020_025762 [Rehmannia glutinosa]|uniref:SUN domain-containing protein n=1 Tax=Rehmannia glutinosa TaxID=99300 RepID=A0ABR0VYS5_REHGL
MSASTVSITANQGPTTRRRAVEKNISAGGSELAAGAVVTETENRDARLTAGDTAAAILRDARKTPSHIQARKSVPARKPTKPRWLTVVSILTKNLALLVVLLGFVQMTRWVVLNSGRDVEDISAISGDFEGKFSEVEKFVKTTMKAMQVQLDVVDQKVEDGFSSVRKEFDEKMEKKGDELDLKLKSLDVRSDAFEKFMDGFGTKSLLSKEEFGEFFEEFKKARKNSASDGGEFNLDEIRNYAREIVEKEIERHAADGLGMVDYALASGGGRVLRHSEPYGGLKIGTSGVWLMSLNRVSAEADKMIRPSFGEPGHCFPLKGRSGFIEIRLRTAIIPEAVTLEHVAKSVAYDRSSAPKHCRVSGWMQGQDSTDLEIDTTKMFLLTEFTYDLDKSNAQTFKVQSTVSNLVDTIRLDVTSNHGSASHTCIYRLRVHGHEPSPVPILGIRA